MISDTRSGPDLRVLDGVAGWCGGLHGSMPLQAALRSLADGLGADAAAIARHNCQEDRPRPVALYDALGTDDPDAVVIGKAFCQDVVGYLFDKAMPSTVWFLSDLVDDASWNTTPTLSSWRLARDVGEIVVIVLAEAHNQTDYIEFHFGRELKMSERLEIEALVPTIVRSWTGRQPGLVTQASMDIRLLKARASAASGKMRWDAPILSMSNPAGLSRAEYRVCLLFSRGLSVAGAAKELGLSENTVKSHKTAIFSKTETSNLAELVYRILSSGQDEADDVALYG